MQEIICILLDFFGENSEYVDPTQPKRASVQGASLQTQQYLIFGNICELVVISWLNMKSKLFAVFWEKRAFSFLVCLKTCHKVETMNQKEHMWNNFAHVDRWELKVQMRAELFFLAVSIDSCSYFFLWKWLLLTSHPSAPGFMLSWASSSGKIKPTYKQ